MGLSIRKIIHSRDGVSLAETLVAAAIFVLLLSGVTATYYASEKYWSSNKVRNEMQRNLRIAMLWLSSELCEAGPSATVLANNFAVNNPSDEFAFWIPSGVVGGATQYAGDLITYRLGGVNGDDLLRIQGADTRVIANNIQTLEFSWAGGSSEIVDVAITAQENTDYGRSLTADLNFSVRLRN